MSPWKVILATMVIFGCGVITGGLVVKVNTVKPRMRVDQGPHPGLVRPGLNNPTQPIWQVQRMEFLHKMEKQLQLTPEQHDRIEKIMHESSERTKNVWETIQPQMKDESHRVREAIRKELTPEQLKKFNDLLKTHPRVKPGSTNAPPVDAPAAK